MTLNDNENGIAHKWIVARPVSFLGAQRKILNVFFVSVLVGVIAAMLGIILYYVYAFAALSGGSDAFNWLLGIFSDYVAIIEIALSESPYVVGGASYPPLAIAILYPFALICRGVFALYMGQGWDIDTLTSRVVLHSEFWISFVLFFVICTSLIVFLVIKAFSLGRSDGLKIAVVIVFSAPFVFAIMRGNTIYFALIFLLLFLWLYDNESPVLREISYICLVLSGLIKIYPLFFGVFLLRKKRIFASVRIAFYFFVLFFLSFFIFEAGLGDFSIFAEQLGDFATNNERIFGLTNLSLTSCMYKLLVPLFPSVENSSAFAVVNMVILAVLLLICAFTATVTKSDFSRYIIAVSVIVLVPTVSYFYILIFAILPFVQFIREYDSISCGRRRFFVAAFLFLFFTLSLLPANFIFHSFVVMAMLVTEIVSVFRREIIPYFANKRAITE